MHLSYLPVFQKREKIFGMSFQAHDDFFAFAFAFVSLTHGVNLIDGALEIVEEKRPITRAIVLPALLQSRRRISRSGRRASSSRRRRGGACHGAVASGAAASIARRSAGSRRQFVLSRPSRRRKQIRIWWRFKDFSFIDIITNHYGR